MWIFLVELISIEETAPNSPEITLSIGISPDENSKEEIESPGDFTKDLYGSEDDEEDYGFDDFEDGF